MQADLNVDDWAPADGEVEPVWRPEGEESDDFIPPPAPEYQPPPPPPPRQQSPSPSPDEVPGVVPVAEAAVTIVKPSGKASGIATGPPRECDDFMRARPSSSAAATSSNVVQVQFLTAEILQWHTEQHSRHYVEPTHGWRGEGRRGETPGASGNVDPRGKMAGMHGEGQGPLDDVERAAVGRRNCSFAAPMSGRHPRAGGALQRLTQ